MSSVFWFLFPVTGTHTRRTSVWTCCGMVIISPLPSSSLWQRSGMPWGRLRGSDPSPGHRDPWKSSPTSWITSTTTWPGLRQLKGKVRRGVWGSSTAETRGGSPWGQVPNHFICEFKTVGRRSTIQPSQLSIFMEWPVENADSQECPDTRPSWWCHSKPG